MILSTVTFAIKQQTEYNYSGNNSEMFYFEEVLSCNFPLLPVSSRGNSHNYTNTLNESCEKNILKHLREVLIHVSLRNAGIDT